MGELSPPVVQPLNHVRLFATPWTAAHQASLSLTIPWSLLKLMRVRDAFQPSSPLLPPSPSAFNPGRSLSFLGGPGRGGEVNLAGQRTVAQERTMALWPQTSVLRELALGKAEHPWNSSWAASDLLCGNVSVKGSCIPTTQV